MKRKNVNRRPDSAKKIKDGNECSICYGDIPTEDGKGQSCPAGTKNCNTQFCSTCIDRWVGKHKHCSHCRQQEKPENKEKRMMRAKIKPEKQYSERIKRFVRLLESYSTEAQRKRAYNNLRRHYRDEPIIYELIEIAYNKIGG